jgi:protoporphyrin/coproporphyrin ferrochelatase
VSTSVTLPAPTAGYDAVIVVSFGGPEGPDEVLPFLENVLRGRSVPRERMLAVAEHYQRFGGVSPINEHNRALVAALDQELSAHGHHLRVYFGNRNWHPLLADTVATMRADGVRRALAFVTSAFGSYSGCRQYLEDIERARQQVGPGAPKIDKLRLFYNHPAFVSAVADGLAATLAAAGPDPLLLFTAHSIPTAMAAAAPYEAQLREAAGLVVSLAGGGSALSPAGGASGPAGLWELVFQSRSGPPTQPWLEPDLLDRLRRHAAGSSPATVVVCPIGFVSDHMEVVYDLDIEAADLARSLDLTLLRAPTAGTHPAFVTMVRQLVDERLDPALPRLALGSQPAWGDQCPAGCCPRPAR